MVKGRDNEVWETIELLCESREVADRYKTAHLKAEMWKKTTHIAQIRNAKIIDKYLPGFTAKVSRKGSRKR